MTPGGHTPEGTWAQGEPTRGIAGIRTQAVLPAGPALPAPGSAIPGEAGGHEGSAVCSMRKSAYSRDPQWEVGARRTPAQAVWLPGPLGSFSDKVPPKPRTMRGLSACVGELSGTFRSFPAQISALGPPLHVGGGEGASCAACETCYRHRAPPHHRGIWVPEPAQNQPTRTLDTSTPKTACSGPTCPLGGKLGLHSYYCTSGCFSVFDAPSAVHTRSNLPTILGGQGQEITLPEPVLKCLSALSLPL